MNKLKYVIVSPRWNTGGAIALHALCKALSENGENAKIFYISRFIYKNGNHKEWWIHWILFTIKDLLQCFFSKIFGADKVKGFVEVSVKGCKRKFFPFFSSKTVVIYPEIVYGNPLRTKKVVRWLLFYYGKGYPDADGSWGPNFEENDLVFCYRKIFNDKMLNPKERILCTPFFDLDLYKKTNFGERKGKCYIVRKGANRKDLPTRYDGIVIDDLPEKEKVKVFNECEYCISYDTQTAYSKIAAICGSVSIVVPEEGKTRLDYRQPEDDCSGIAFGFDESEIEFARRTQPLAKKSYEKFNNESQKQVERFIEECNEYFK